MKTDSDLQSAGRPTKSNRLALEKSPYLLQHQTNPVDWYPWGPEAFTKARTENKPVFLSVGYSTCHWCHVMERESFENQQIADFLNEHFVSIKVDREERPDIDKIYMTFVQATTGQGGWPLSAFLTPDLKPFYGGTYFPPEPKFGRPSFLQLLERLAELWATRRNDLAQSAIEFHQRLSQFTQQPASAGPALDADVLHKAARAFKEEYDPQFGGFGQAPKFPRPSQPLLLLRYGQRFNDQEAVRMVLHTCEAMAGGGIYDQLGGGFSRYSVDAHWLVPHFEKMLYDNAQLVNLFLDAFLASGNVRFAEVAKDILNYVFRDMTHSGGAFYSAEDADSEGKEGKFYCWTTDELSQLLTSEEYNVAVRYFGITQAGNFVDHSDPDPLPNQNVLFIADPNIPDQDTDLLKSAKAKMFEARSKRIRPHLDDKILASWNGLMISAIARAYATLRLPAYREAAGRALRFIKENLWDRQSKRLYSRWRDGERNETELQAAYAAMLTGVLDLYEATLDPDHLQFALELADSMQERFFDKDRGGYWQSTNDAPDLILRMKEDYDGAEPSGNSLAACALLKLAAIADRPDLKVAAERTLHFLSDRLQSVPQSVPHLLLALEFWLFEPKRAVVTGPPESAEVMELLHVIHGVSQPNRVVLGTSGPVESTARQMASESRSMVHICSGQVCLPPTSDPAQIRDLLSAR